MDDGADVGLINAHAKRHCGHHDLGIITLEGLVGSGALVGGHLGVVPGDGGVQGSGATQQGRA
jgi:hypothetical protein